ncbi:lamin tail domain-containing protein, partial [Pseudoalteromonas sp.]|uniref:lamin tail domain-containing protein n=1 Tax=Pseudoalteromonas sp. TaxID=53249 RepID=UPI0035645529
MAKLLLRKFKINYSHVMMLIFLLVITATADAKKISNQNDTVIEQVKTLSNVNHNTSSPSPNLNTVTEHETYTELANPNYLVLFKPQSVSFIPTDGPKWHWQLSKITGFDQTEKIQAQHFKNKIVYQHSQFIEQYLIKNHAIEQQFILNELPKNLPDEFVIEGAVSTNGILEISENGWNWRNEDGVVSLGLLNVFDANGKRLEATMLVEQSKISYKIAADVLQSAQFPILIDPEIGTNDFRISFMGPDNSSAYTALNPDVAFNPKLNEYLVVWEGDDNTAPLVDNKIEIFGQRINAQTGALVGNRIRIGNVANDGNTNFRANTPTVAYSDKEEEYLVCWSGDHQHADYPTLADNEIEIFCNYVKAADGSTPYKIIRYSTMGPDGNISFAAFNPALAYNKINNEYLLVWEGADTTSSEYEIYGQRIDSVTGKQIGTIDFRISDMGIDGNADFDALRPDVAHNFTNNEYLVVWGGEDQANMSEWEIYGQRINGSSGQALGTNELGVNDFRISDMGPENSSDYYGFEPAVAYNSFNNEYLVVWEGEDNTLPLIFGESEIFGQRLSGATAGEIGENDFRISDAGPNGDTAYDAYGADVEYNKLNNEYLVVWTADEDTGLLVDDEYEIYGQRILASTGAAIGDNDFRISDMGADGNANYDADFRALAYNNTNNEFLVVWHGENQTQADEWEIFGQRIALDQKLVINEVDYDQPSIDTNEFIELKNNGDTYIDLSNYTLDLYTEATASVYDTITIPKTLIAPGDYYVICGNNSKVANCDQDDDTDINMIQNGAPDAVALKFGASIMDVISYEGSSSSPYVETSGAGVLDDPSMNSGSIARIPDGTDTNDNSSDWSFVCATPGSANLNVSSDCNLAPSLTLNLTNVLYSENSGAIVIDANASVIDKDSVDFDGGNLTVSISGNGTVNDRLSIKNTGIGAGEIGYDPVTGNVLYSGTVIGVASGGTNGATPLFISFNVNANETNINALLKELTYQNISENPNMLARTLTFSVADDDPDTSNQPTLMINVTGVNDGPSITSTAGTSATEDVQYTYAASVNDPDDANDGSQLSWSLTNPPSGMVVSNTGVVSWTPTEGVTSSGTVTLTVQDGGENGALPS